MVAGRISRFERDAFIGLAQRLPGLDFLTQRKWQARRTPTPTIDRHCCFSAAREASGARQQGNEPKGRLSGRHREEEEEEAEEEREEGHLGAVPRRPGAERFERLRVRERTRNPDRD